MFLNVEYLLQSTNLNELAVNLSEIISDKKPWYVLFQNIIKVSYSEWNNVMEFSLLLILDKIIS